MSHHYYIRILEDGSFDNVHDKSLYLKQGSIVRVVLSLRTADMEPLVLIQKRNFAKKTVKVDHILKEQLYGTREVDLPLKSLTKTFLRQQFNIREFLIDEQGDYYYEHLFEHTGSQFFRLIYYNQDQIVKLGKPNFFIVQPHLSLESITIQTVLPHSLGPFEQWKVQLQSQIALGYKAFHFPPIQQLGESGSLYSISNQLQLNPTIFHNTSETELTAFFEQMHQEHGTLFFIDILLNHTAFDSEWLGRVEFKDASYNQDNSPYLNCAIELDKAIGNFSNQLGERKLENYPSGNQIMDEIDLQQIMTILEQEFINPLNLHEFFLIDIDETINKLLELLQTKLSTLDKDIEEDDDDDNIFIKNPRELFKKVIQDNIIEEGHKRNGVTLNFIQVVTFLTVKDNHKKVSVEYLRQLLKQINHDQLQKAHQYLRQAIDSTRGQIRWSKIEQHDHTVISTKKGDSLVPRYFTELPNGMWAANNGWIQDFDTLKNFATSDGHHYFKRSIIIWGDLVKLRYGSCKQDSPALWNFMKQYVQLMAKMFHGMRLDNAHSTPLNVGSYMMRKARKTDQNLLIFAELFSGSSYNDSLFTKQLGLNALVREMIHIKDGQSLDSSLNFYSGSGRWSVGSLPMLTEVYGEQHYTLLRSQYAPALVYEQSHDNETLIQSHGFKHQMPISALVAFSKCMKGTVRGYDQYYPKKLSVVTERRQYSLPSGTTKQSHEAQSVQLRLDLPVQPKLVEVRGSFNNWDQAVQMTEVKGNDVAVYTYVTALTLPEGDYEYRYLVDGEWHSPSDKQYNVNGNHTLKVSNLNIQEHDSLEPIRKLLSETAQDLDESYPFQYVCSHYNSLVQINRYSKNCLKSRVVIAQPDFEALYQYHTIELPGIIESVDYICLNTDIISFPLQDRELLPADVKILQHKNLLQYCDIYYNVEKRNHVLKFTRMIKSLVIVLSCRQESEFQSNLTAISEMDFYSPLLFNQHFQGLTSNDIHFLLFCSEPEEQELSNQGMYSLPNYGKLVYGGFYGPLQPIRNACQSNNLGHSICDNLRQGNWLLDYLANRLNHLTSDTSQSLRLYISQTFDLIKKVPRYLIPLHFSKFVEGVCFQIMSVVQARALPWIKKAPLFRQLSVSNYQFVAQIPSAQFDHYKTTMSAGHPHFSIGWSRVWGRDTFIAFKGNLLLSGMVKEAREIILQFASCLRHGLLPNLLDAGRNCRYNNRDACWWFIRAVKDYIEHTGDSGIWNEKIKMQFLDNDYDKHHEKVKQGKTLQMRLQDVVQNIVESHARGIQFREWRAGKDIDSQMDSEGFNISLKMDEETGFIIGGNYRNCLTWMDKMGSSEKAGNKGFPATSRDGAPIEMTALLKCALDFLIKQHQSKLYDFEGVTMKNQTKLTFKQWADFIAQNFERFYWIPKETEHYSQYNVTEKYVRHKQIYRDVTKSSKPRNDYQLRPNACIAIAVAPELFNRIHAQHHLATTESNLIEQGSLGIKTLDKIATEYSSYYDNADDSDNFKLAHGFSYHNGPEWVWVYAYYLKALTAIYKMDDHVFYSYLTNHKKYIQENQWFSLPEITNGNGEPNQFSCPAQAWSVACILEAINDFHNKK